MKLLRLVLAAAALSIATTACGSDVVGPTPSVPSYGQGAFGSGG